MFGAVYSVGQAPIFSLSTARPQHPQTHSGVKSLEKCDRLVNNHIVLSGIEK